MYILGHLGIGYTMIAVVKPLRKKLPLKPLLLGTILPDLTDKLLYYSLAFGTGRQGADLGWVAGTRNFGHTAMFLLLLGIIARVRRSLGWEALAWGVATHLFLDNLGDLFQIHKGNFAGFTALVWPTMGWQFPVIPYRNLTDQLSYWIQPAPLTAELIGALLIARLLWAERRQSISAAPAVDRDRPSVPS